MSGNQWARWGEARRGGERAGARRSSRRKWRRRRLSFSRCLRRAREGIESKVEWEGRRARPSSGRQRAAASGWPWRVAATRQQSPSMVATSTDRCCPLSHFTEHVAGSDVGKVEHRFGSLPGRIRHWAINKVCSPRPALRFLFKVPGHLSFVTADN